MEVEMLPSKFAQTVRAFYGKEEFRQKALTADLKEATQEELGLSDEVRLLIDGLFCEKRPEWKQVLLEAIPLGGDLSLFPAKYLRAVLGDAKMHLQEHPKGIAILDDTIALTQRVIGGDSPSNVEYATVLEAAYRYQMKKRKWEPYEAMEMCKKAIAMRFEKDCMWCAVWHCHNFWWHGKYDPEEDDEYVLDFYQKTMKRLRELFIEIMGERYKVRF